LSDPNACACVHVCVLFVFPLLLPVVSLVVLCVRVVACVVICPSPYRQSSFNVSVSSFLFFSFLSVIVCSVLIHILNNVCIDLCRLLPLCPPSALVHRFFSSLCPIRLLPAQLNQQHNTDRHSLPLVPNRALYHYLSLLSCCAADGGPVACLQEGEMRGAGPIILLLIAAAAAVVVHALPGFLSYGDVRGAPYSVTYNNRSLLLNGHPSLFLSGSIHYPRSTPAMWPELLRNAAADGLNLIEIYVFWNFHQPTDGPIDWGVGPDGDGRTNLTRFLDICAENNLFVNFRIGPYVCAEW
jgi:hypothetical protein